MRRQVAMAEPASSLSSRLDPESCWLKNKNQAEPLSQAAGRRPDDYGSLGLGYANKGCLCQLLERGWSCTHNLIV